VYEAIGIGCPRPKYLGCRAQSGEAARRPVQKTSPEIPASVLRSSGGGRRPLIGHPRQRIYSAAAPGLSFRRNTRREPATATRGGEKHTSSGRGSQRRLRALRQDDFTPAKKGSCSSPSLALRP
jgi:hypothetical protein